MPKVLPEYKQQARERIIEQALKTFSEKGYHQTRIADVASDIGVSKGAIYQYFESKEQLFIEAIKYHGEKRGMVLRGYLDSGSFRSISTAQFFDDMLELRLSSLRLSVDVLREIGSNLNLKKMMDGVAEEWGRELLEVVD
jgi:AcrR family transcriptional regulator